MDPCIQFAKLIMFERLILLSVSREPIVMHTRVCNNNIVVGV